MADRKITDLTALAAGSQATGDLLPIVDVSEAAAADKNKKITVESLFKGIPSNVGIGTSSPSRSLDVSGNGVHVSNTGTTGAAFNIVPAANGQDGAELILSFHSGTGYGPLKFNVGNAERMRIDSSGRLLLGTTSAANAASYADNLVIGTTSGDNGMTIVSGTSDAGSVNFSDGTGTNSTKGIIQYSHSSNALYCYTDGSERVRIDSNGRLGLGTSSPSTKLHIASTAAGGDIHVTNASGQNCLLEMAGNGNTISSGNALYGQDASNNVYAGWARGAHPVLFGTSNTERMRLLSDGKLLLGATSGSYDLEVKKSGRVEVLIGSTDADGATLLLDGDSNGDGSGSDYASLGHASTGHLEYKNRKSSGAHTFHTGSSDTERMRINTSGTVCINRTDSVVGTNKLSIEGDGTNTIVGVQTGSTTATVNFAQFFDGSGTSCGGIAVNGTTNTTSYITTSDHRLKENIVDITGAIARLNNLAPKRFNFIDDTTQTTLDGFIAHEVQSVVPEAVVGDHNEVDDDDNPVYQGIDQSKLVPLLTAALQEAIAKIEILETKVAALEAQ